MRKARNRSIALWWGALLSACVAVGGCLALSTEPPPWKAPPADANLPPTPPPVPRGFGSEREALFRAATAQVRLIRPPLRTPKGIHVIKDIVYGHGGETPLELDLALPLESNGPTPGLVFIHGGGWDSLDRSVYRFYVYTFAQRGYAAATISYRLSGEAPFPAAVHDAKCAVRWMRANADAYGIDPDRIAVIGGSAGGHLAMMVGYTAGAPELEGDGGYAGVSSAVQAVVTLYGPYDLNVLPARDASVVLKFLGISSYKEDPDLFRRASPMRYLDGDAPPTLVIHGTIDDVVPVSQSDRLVARLARLGVPHVYDRIEGWPHGLDIAEPLNERCLWFMERFLREHLGTPGG